MELGMKDGVNEDVGGDEGLGRGNRLLLLLCSAGLGRMGGDCVW